MARQHWTEQEIRDASTIPDWDTFHRLHPRRDYGAVWQKMNRMGLPYPQKGVSPQVDPEPVPTVATVPPPEPVQDPTPIVGAKPDPAEEELEVLFTSLERAEAARGHLSPTDDVIHVTAPDDAPTAIAFMSDIHAGASGVDYGRFRRDLEVIRDTPGLYVVVNGDLVENAKVMSKAGNALYHAAFTNPREQMLYVRKRLAIAQGKILAILSGNHDSRDGSHAGIDRLPQLCQHLDVPYGTEAGMTIYFTVGGHRYTIVAKHDYQGKSQITKSNSARRLWTEWPHSWDSADVIALAHLHEPNLAVTHQRGQEVVWLRSGAFKVHDEYALSKGYRSAYGVPVVVFFPGTRKMVPFLDFDEGVRYLAAARLDWLDAQAA